MVEAAAEGVAAKLMYIVVVEDGRDAVEEKKPASFRYTRSALQSTLQLMGCKPRHAFKISKRVFEMMKHESSAMDKLALPCMEGPQQGAEVYPKEKGCSDSFKNANGNCINLENCKSKSKPFELFESRTTVVVSRKNFLDVICEALAEYKYVGRNQRADLVLACRIRERKTSVTVLLCGTSGCGKSTLSALLASRLGITSVISTDSIRHMMRSFVDEKQNPLLWASTYHAGEYLDPLAVAEAKTKRKAKDDTSVIGKSPSEGASTMIEMVSKKKMAVEGFKAQSEMVIDSLDRLITSWEERKESVVVEGVHLSLNFVMGLMKKHPSIIPFMVYISNEEKHLERFAVRAKYMTLDPARNKYVKYIRNIRTIQEYLCNRADKHLVPKINNTNVDKSVAVIHATVFSCLRRREAGEQLYDLTTNTVTVIDGEYRNQSAANSMTSKGMFQLIQRKDSSPQLMALLNNDGSVAKVWPVDIVDDNSKAVVGNHIEKENGTSASKPLQIVKGEPVNLHFGHLGISAWPSDIGGTSRGSSMDESRERLTDDSSRGCSSSTCSPRISEGPSKELKEEESVHGSDEETDDQPEIGSDEDISEAEEHLHEEPEGSVDEESTKSDEEYDDLAMQDTPDRHQICYDDEESNKLNDVALHISGIKSNTNASYGRASLGVSASRLAETNEKRAPRFKETNDKRVQPITGYRSRRRSKSFSSLYIPTIRSASKS